MSYWDDRAQTIVDFPDRPIEGYPGWVTRDCGCCNGLEWSRETPEECLDCAGSGFFALHVETGTMAEYPGGRLLGRLAKQEETME